jgi:hypothetical protein
MPAIIIPGRFLGKTRSEHQRNLKKEGWSAGLSGEQLDKCEYLERTKGKRWYRQEDIDKVR